MRAQKCLDVRPAVLKGPFARHRESITIARLTTLAQDGLGNQLLKNPAVTEQSSNLDGLSGNLSARFQEALNQRRLAFLSLLGWPCADIEIRKRGSTWGQARGLSFLPSTLGPDRQARLET